MDGRYNVKKRTGKGELELYFHIPFCVRKCLYCDFLSAPADGETIGKYMEALLAETVGSALSYEDYTVSTVFIGGGTPSVAAVGDIERLLEAVGRCYRLDSAAEVTMEVNPGTVCGEMLARLRSAGVNRLSIGLQSADNAELKMLGRIHTYEAFLQTYHQAREAGFANINIDLMSALPGQHIKNWVRTLEKVAALQPEHVSAYSLIIEEGTPLYEHLDAWAPVPEEDEDRQMYEETKRLLAQQGYHRYEISNYAKPGYACRHNQVYWTRGDYAGFGLGAASMVDNVRWSNPRSIPEYRDALLRPYSASTDFEPAERTGAGLAAAKTDLTAARARLSGNVQYLSVQEQMEEFMFLGLRLTKGVSKQDFRETFGLPIEEVYGKAIEALRRDGLLLADDFVRLTPFGTDISNYVMEKFLFG